MTIRVLHCIHSLSGGGAERQLMLLANHCKKANLEFAIFCIDPSGNCLIEGCSELYVIKDRSNYPWRLVGEIESVIDQFKPDILHCWLPPTLVVPGLLAAKKKKIKAIMSYRAARAFYSIKDILECFFGFMFANAVVSNNTPDQSSNIFRKLYFSKIHTQIPNAVAVPKEFAALKAQRKKNDAFTFLYVGRLVDAKNWQTLLKAVSLIKSKNRSWRLLLCGTGDDGKVQEEIVQLGLQNQVSMLGFRDDIYKIMAESDLLVLPSWREGMPNVPLEALSIGLPCVVSNIVAHKSLFSERSGVEFFDPNSAEDLAKILLAYVEGDRNLGGLAANGVTFSDDFTPEVLVNKYHQFYGKVLGKEEV